MIGLFDSGLGGLTVLRELVRRFPGGSWTYLADHANVPIGNRSTPEIVELTRQGVETLFGLGSRLVLLACNTATCAAARPLQQAWLPASPYRGTHNVLGIVAPTVEAATQTAWGVTTPQYPQKYNSDTIAVFGTTRTIASGVFPEEIGKRCPKVTVVSQACPLLAGAIEGEASEAELDRLVATAVGDLLRQTGGAPPHRAILGCTHYPLVEHLFRRHLPPFTRILSQPETVADSLEDYLARHPRYLSQSRGLRVLTTGDAAAVSAAARVFWPEAPRFEAAPGRSALAAPLVD